MAKQLRLMQDVISVTVARVIAEKTSIMHNIVDADSVIAVRVFAKMYAWKILQIAVTRAILNHCLQGNV